MRHLGHSFIFSGALLITYFCSGQNHVSEYVSAHNSNCCTVIDHLDTGLKATEVQDVNNQYAQLKAAMAVLVLQYRVIKKV